MAEGCRWMDGWMGARRLAEALEKAGGRRFHGLQGAAGQRQVLGGRSSSRPRHPRPLLPSEQNSWEGWGCCQSRGCCALNRQGASSADPLCPSRVSLGLPPLLQPRWSLPPGPPHPWPQVLPLPQEFSLPFSPTSWGLGLAALLLMWGPTESTCHSPSSPSPAWSGKLTDTSASPFVKTAASFSISVGSVSHSPSPLSAKHALCTPCLCLNPSTAQTHSLLPTQGPEPSHGLTPDPMADGWVPRLSS